MKYLGKQGIDQMIHHMHLRAVQFAEGLAALEGFTVLNEVVFNQVAVACASDERTNQVLARIQQDGICWVGGSSWKGRRIIRISVCSWMTTEEDVALSLAAFRSALHDVEGGSR
jgi:glutamate/tyrosine decarboxylase-like PLP-dependent enzyme